MTRLFAAIAAVAVAGCLFVAAAYVAGLTLPFMVHHPLFTRLLGFAAPTVAVVVSMGVAIVFHRKRELSH